ncbi:MAG: hypothetical protein ABI690_15635 [Chloroflexota bacterium]
MSEVIDKNHVLPHRLFAMAAAVNECPNIPRADLLRLVQPSPVNESLETSGNIFIKCQLCGLIAESQDKLRTATLAVDPRVVTDFEAFRTYMQLTLLGVTNEDEDHFILNQFTAWYATQDDTVLTLSKHELETRFHDGVYPGVQNLVIRDEPGIGAWQAWAQFLGSGWQSEFSVFVPDCTLRVLPLLPDLLPDTDFISFSLFMEHLSAHCSELDGGALFERCWEACRPQERRGNRLSLMLSTALRVLNQRGVITLENRADSTENWTLFPAQSYIARVTHIRRGTSQ